MRKMSADEIRKTWLDFWKSKGHMIEPSASLVPNNDPTLLWINAGVAALKKYFDGSEVPTSRRISNIQKCLRTNDIENVGMTARHQTFFEMLGNFSIGDYFRKEAVTWAYELLTSDKYFGIPVEKLYFTVFPGDKETSSLWISLGVPSDHLVPCEGNFWEIGEGPCGPDTEIFFDRGEKYDPDNIGPRLISDDIENDRYIEIWNIVFSQFNSKEGVERKDYKELPNKNIDTGGGLERFCCVLQGVESNFETDLFTPIIKATEELASIKYSLETKMAYHVIADHIRTCSFALADGAMFSNEGRGYVLRRILRRGVRYGKKLGIQGSFMYKLVDVVIKVMEGFYPYLNESKDRVKKYIEIEEEKFEKTLNAGENKLKEIIDSSIKELSGKDAFLLYDTYGFPLELTKEICLESNINVNEVEFKEEMNKQKERARASRKKENSMHSQSSDLIDFTSESIFSYEVEDQEATIIGLFKDGTKVDCIEDNGAVILSNTNFYGESGGEVGDKGYLEVKDGLVDVIDTIKAPNKQNLHIVETNGLILRVNDKVKTKVNKQARLNIQRNHSAVHILQKVLQEVLGDHIKQAGSYVDEYRLRFDFTHYEKISDKDLKEIEYRVNNIINKGLVNSIKIMDKEDALKLGAMALFNEKYGDKVRVVNFDNYSIEFCGGCHVANTSDIGIFVIVKEESISSGVRRIEATTSINAFNLLKEKENKLDTISSILNVSSNDSIDKINQLVKELDEYKNKVEELNKSKLQSLAKDIISKAVIKDNIYYIVTFLDNVDKNLPMSIIDNLKGTGKEYFVYIINKSIDKLSLLCGCSKKANEIGYNAGAIIKETSIISGGNGGGSIVLAQAGGKDTSKVETIIKLVKEKVNLCE